MHTATRTTNDHQLATIYVLPTTTNAVDNCHSYLGVLPCTIAASFLVARILALLSIITRLSIPIIIIIVLYRLDQL